MIYRFRVILDTHEDVFRDIEIEASSSFEDLHNTITQSFGFGGQEMASFYLSNELWDQGDEISLFDMGEKPGEVMVMSDNSLESLVNKDQTRMIYIYDFLNMWTFLVELAEIAEVEDGRSYPNLMFAHGQIPEDAPEKEFIAENMGNEDVDEELDFDPEDYDNTDFDANWN
jgi:hypothetical protein